MRDILNTNSYNSLIPLRLIRIVRNQGVSDFAKSICISNQFIWEVEGGRRSPSDSFLVDKLININIEFDDFKRFVDEVNRIKKLKIDSTTKYQMALFKALVLVYPELNRCNDSVNLSADKGNAYKFEKTIESYDNNQSNEGKVKIAEKCSLEMLIRIFGTMEEDIIFNKIYSKNCAISSNYLLAVYKRIVEFPKDLGNAMKHMPGLYFDPFYLSDALVEGYTFGIVNRIVAYCNEENISYSYEDNILMLDNEVLAVNNELLVSVIEINKRINRIKRRNKTK